MFPPIVSLCMHSFWDGYRTQQDVFICCSLARLLFLTLPAAGSWSASSTQHLSSSCSITTRGLLRRATGPERGGCQKMHTYKPVRRLFWLRRLKLSTNGPRRAAAAALLFINTHFVTIPVTSRSSQCVVSD